LKAALDQDDESKLEVGPGKGNDDTTTKFGLQEVFRKSLELRVGRVSLRSGESVSHPKDTSPAL
jgi:hypothetical protein